MAARAMPKQTEERSSQAPLEAHPAALPEEVEAYEQDWFFDRLEVLPGITGLWQVSGRSNLSFDDYMRLDLSYVENWSIGFDLFILAKTVPALLSRKGAW